MKINQIMVGPVRSLEVGDQIAYSFLGGVITGTITAIIYSAADLTSEQRTYLQKDNISIPGKDWEPVGGYSGCLLFGDFVDTSGKQDRDRVYQFGHMFVDYNVIVAIFPTN